MNSIETPTMEEQIQLEEPVPQKETIAPVKEKPPIKINFSNLKEKSAHFIKIPKLTTVFVLFFVFILILIGLIVVSSRKNAATDTLPGVVIATPEPQTKTEDPQTKAIEDKLDEYDNKVDALGNNLNSYQAPQMDLNINF